MKDILPLAREARLIIKELDGEVLVYDLDSDKAHCLNQTAALIWKLCNGKRTVAQLRELIERETALASPEEVVWLALDQLEKFRLLESVPSKPPSLAGMKRRQIIKTFGIAAVALPVIVSIVSPTAVSAGSKMAPGGCCDGNGNCESNSCVPQTPPITCPLARVCA